MASRFRIADGAYGIPALSSTHLQEGINPVQGMFIEMFVTSFLVLAVLMLAVEKHDSNPFAPVSLSY